MNFDLDFYKGKTVLVTGHTGFKGTWMCQVLLYLGSKVIGYGLEPQDNAFAYDLSGVDAKITSVIGDIRDFAKLKKVFDAEKPQIVIHMAAQPLVRTAYEMPMYTYDVNVMGTVNVLECVRLCDSVKSFVNVTTDKVYLNREWEWGYRETDELNGYDPYSNSKSCSELVTSSYKKSFFDGRVAVSTVRAGNVIGGGDFSRDRIIPDCVLAASEGKDIVVRNPNSVRPYQHVLEPVFVYLKIAQEQYVNLSLAGNYNVGPDEKDCIRTKELVTLFCEKWEKIIGKPAAWKNINSNGPHEANFLRLDCAKLRNIFGWKPVWEIDMAVEKTIEWYKVWLEKGSISTNMITQINEFLCVQNNN